MTLDPIPLDELYQDVILQHSRRPRNHGTLDHATHEAFGVNAACGDEIHLQLQVDGDVISQARFTGHACAICTASASLLTCTVMQHSRTDAVELSGRFRSALLTGEVNQIPNRLVPLGGVHRWPQRVKCAVLPWEALEKALQHPKCETFE